MNFFKGAELDEEEEDIPLEVVGKDEEVPAELAKDEDVLARPFWPPQEKSKQEKRAKTPTVRNCLEIFIGNPLYLDKL